MIDARKSRNLAQKQLAETIGINQADISKLENGNAPQPHAMETITFA